jgi:hypothetical protein
MVEVETYQDPEFGNWAGAVVGHPEMNGSGETEAQMRGYIVVAWNRDNPDDPKSLEDFNFTQLDERPEWA